MMIHIILSSRAIVPNSQNIEPIGHTQAESFWFFLVLSVLLYNTRQSVAVSDRSNNNVNAKKIFETKESLEKFSNTLKESNTTRRPR